ncbi:MAG TPA: rhodanese-like domain-containing protein, partial [Polyangia bacterium]
GARHIGRGVLERDVEALLPDKDAPIVLYCGGGFRSALAAESLQKMGYTHVVSMEGGMRAWREAGYPVE